MSPLVINVSVADINKPVVAVTLSGLLSIIEPIAGDDVEVVSLLPSGTEAHYYTLQPDIVQKALAADLIVCTGHIPWELELAEKVADEKGLEVSDVVLDLLHDVDVTLLKEPGTDQPNIHAFWLLPENAKKVALAVAERLAVIDPDDSQTFLRRAETFSKKVDALQKESMVRMKKAGLLDSKVVVAFYAEQYLAKAMGLRPEFILMREGGLSPIVLEQVREGLLNGTLKAIIYSEIAEGFPQVLGQIRALSEEVGVPTYKVQVFSIGEVHDYLALLSYDIGILTSISNRIGNSSFSGFYLYLSALLAVLVAMEFIIIIFLYRRLSER
jgi:ABC-type Zn uptake system ZnuABC Zn-binding protein ZnuA